MEKEFVTYEQALALKELGFDEPCFGFYSVLYDLMITQTNSRKSLFESECLAPLKQQVFRWFRDKYTLYSIISTIMHTYPNLEFYFKIQGINHGAMTDKFQTYEEAESACIDKLIEILKDK